MAPIAATSHPERLLVSFHIVGLDLSLTSTGAAIVRPGEPTRFTTITSKAVANAQYPDTLTRIRTICAHTLRWIRTGREEGDVTVVAMEAPIYPAGKALGMYHTRAGHWWMLYHLLEKEAHVVTIEPTKLKSYVTGKGNSSKEAMVATISRNFPDLAIYDDNQADAIGLANMVARELGHPQEPSVQRCNPGALEGVAWPDWITERRTR